MAKATIQDLLDAGFRAQQFGNPADFTTAATGYLARALNDTAVFVRDQVGAAAYDGAAGGSIVERNIKLAEKYFTAAELWRRRETFVDGDVRLAAQDNGAQTVSSRQLTTAEALEEKAWEHLARVVPGASAGGSIAVGHEQSGPFPEHAA